MKRELAILWFKVVGPFGEDVCSLLALDGGDIPMVDAFVLDREAKVAFSAAIFRVVEWDLCRDLPRRVEGFVRVQAGDWKQHRLEEGNRVRGCFEGDAQYCIGEWN